MPAPREPITLVLTEAALELVPRNLRSHSSVVSNAVKQGKDPARVLLDSSFHHRAMRGLVDGERRGRPDIVHFCALLAQGSRLNAAGRLRLLIHTVNDVVISVKSETRLPRVYDRFKGLAEQVLVEGAVPKDERFLFVEEGGLKQAVDRGAFKRVVLLTPSGTRTTLSKLFPAKAKLDGTAIMIGAFAHGDFTEATRKLATQSASIADEPLEAWSVEGEVLHRLAEVEGLK
jgi:rRNA small subunit pseudouridine methyltransferase Nep1